ncbi:PP2C family protein-serine/threonine phosphatase [Thermomonospora amylolytica]|uniref:PP2C family protein-serine/threonine phosphatase n=1 Tax=Thermomonospora amylolytica TaxID=1411117 RepID=UPI000E6BE7EB|nr:PP2C family protein-serine/threonine phosphatase [Thermomonospora amylolytica]
MISERLSALELALWQAQPHAVADAARTAVTAAFSARNTEIWLADYQVALLIPVTPKHDPVRIEDCPAGRAFASQRPVPEPFGERFAIESGGRLHLPLTVHGDRMGVLTVTLARMPDADEVDELVAAAAVVSRALAVADTRTDAFRRIRRRARLTLAAEIQWDLLPGRACVTDEYSLAGQLEPAYAVWGDNFDWAAASDHLTVTVTNGMGQGIDAALLTHLSIGALRNARRSGADLTEQAAMANQAVYAQHAGDRYVGTLLLRFDLEAGVLRAVDAGSPRMFRLRDGAVTPIALEQQMPLGMFGDTEYVEQEIPLRSGDRLVVVSDGVHDSLSADGRSYGALGLLSALRRTRLQNPPEVVRTLIRELLAYTRDNELADDAVIVCLDWTGRSAGTPR